MSQPSAGFCLLQSFYGPRDELGEATLCGELTQPVLLQNESNEKG